MTSEEKIQLVADTIIEAMFDPPEVPLDDALVRIYRKVALKVLDVLDVPAQQTPDQYEFPYQRTFDAICAAVDTLRPGGGSYSVSVKSFQDKFNNHRDAESSPLKGLSVPSTERCAKCGCETKREEALVNGEIWCHPCADGAT